MAMLTNEKDIAPMGTTLVTSINSSSSLRRKSFHTGNALSPTLSENNDMAERLARRHEINVTNTSVENVNTNNKRRSLGLSFLAQMSAPEIKDRITECIKLNTENKINTKNAFSLEVIDFMIYMIKKKDSDMSNLQVASASLDASTKIYGFRVDGVHTEIMKMVGGLDKQEDESSTNDVNEHLNSGQVDQVNGLPNNERKKKKRQRLFSTADSLKGTIETLKPSLWIMENQDSQTADALYQVMLSNHANSKYYLHLYNDVIVDTVEHKKDIDSIKVAIPNIENFSESEICPPLTNFEFLGFINENTNEEDENTESKEDNENNFQFDLDASLPHDDVTHNDINYLDIQDDVEDIQEEIDRCVQRQKPIEKIVDLRKVVSNTGIINTSEYSFVQKNCNVHWAGPTHWRICNFSKLPGGSKIVEACPQQPVRKLKEIEICYDDSKKEAVTLKFALTNNSRIPSRSDWHEEKHTLPRDIHYNIANTTKLYLHKLIEINIKRGDELNITNISDVIENYDYNNENDTSNYCPYVPNEDYRANEDNSEDEHNGGTETEMIFTGDNLVAVPKLTNKLSIMYNTRAKRIDMRQLKKSIWKSLIEHNNNRENINTENTKNLEEENKMTEIKNFSEIYKTLPNILTKTNIEALSFPISFVSLLHLANEKTLKIQSLPDMSDLIVETN